MDVDGEGRVDDLNRVSSTAITSEDNITWAVAANLDYNYLLTTRIRWILERRLTTSWQSLAITGLLSQPPLVMESLLSPSETHAFQSFLSSIDYNDQASTSPPEWGGSVYALHHQYRDDDILVDNVPQAQGTEALAKATKDLMSLDSDRWNSSSMSANHSHSQHDFNQQHQVYDSQGQYQHHAQHQLQQPHRSSYSSSSRDSFPFLHTKNQQLRQQPSSRSEGVV